jgi:hypothetical protein
MSPYARNVHQTRPFHTLSCKQPLPILVTMLTLVDRRFVLKLDRFYAQCRAAQPRAICARKILNATAEKTILGQRTSPIAILAQEVATIAEGEAGASRGTIITRDTWTANIRECHIGCESQISWWPSSLSIFLLVLREVVLVFMLDGLFPLLSRNLTAPARTSPPPPPSCLSQRRDGRATNSMLID